MAAKPPLKTYHAAGGIVLDSAGRVLLLERHVPRTETPSHEIRLPKGHIKKHEGSHEAAMREVGEESGYWHLEILADLGEGEVAFEFKGQRIQRRERYFLMRLTNPRRGQPRPSRPDAEEALFQPLWAADLAEAYQWLTFESERAFILKAQQWLEHHPSSLGQGSTETGLSPDDHVSP